MGKDKFSKTLGWEVFQSMGDPNNPELAESEEATENPEVNLAVPIRIYIERKGRGGKEVSVIKGIDLEESELRELCKKLKAKCGVGGSTKEGQIIIQGDQRNRLIKELHIMGYHNVKNAGA